jgi:hypothetical protein
MATIGSLTLNLVAGSASLLREIAGRSERTPSALADAPRMLARDPELRLEMGQRGRERAVAEFS